MTSDSDTQQQWWRAKELSLKRKEVRTVRKACANAGDAFLIVTEGTVTEPVYFELLRQSLQLSTVTVKIMPGRASDPLHVIRTADDEVKKLAKRVKKKATSVNEPEKFDHVWAILDSDVPARKGKWNDVVQLAQGRKVKLAHSTPCFEFWLLLHLTGFTTRGDLYDGKTAKHAVKEALGEDYSTNEKTARIAIPKFLPKWPEAVLKAEKVREHHIKGGTKPPCNPSTEVDLLVLALNDASSPIQRKLPCRDSDVSGPL